MPDLSFVIYTHSFRADNLIKMLGELSKNEPKLSAEIIIVFQDDKDVVVESRFSIKKHFLGINTYKKPLMCNTGIALAESPVIVILDSDRILPENYFYDNLQLLQPKEIVTTKWLKQYTVDGNHFIENRSMTNEINCKNLFAGNTMMWRRDWFGADESFIGYGSADNDMTSTAMSLGLIPKFLDIYEIHLYHPREIIFEGRRLKDREWGLVAFTNLLRYVKKWKLDKPKVYKDAEWWHRNIKKYPENLRNFFLNVYQQSMMV